MTYPDRRDCADNQGRIVPDTPSYRVPGTGYWGSLRILMLRRSLQSSLSLAAMRAAFLPGGAGGRDTPTDPRPRRNSSPSDIRPRRRPRHARSPPLRAPGCRAWSRPWPCPPTPRALAARRACAWAPWGRCPGTPRRARSRGRSSRESPCARFGRRGRCRTWVLSKVGAQNGQCGNAGGLEPQDVGAERHEAPPRPGELRALVIGKPTLRAERDARWSTRRRAQVRNALAICIQKKADPPESTLGNERDVQRDFFRRQRQPRAAALLECCDLAGTHLLPETLSLATRRHGARPRIEHGPPHGDAELHGLFREHEHAIAIADGSPQLDSWRFGDMFNRFLFDGKPQLPLCKLRNGRFPGSGGADV